MESMSRQGGASETGQSSDWLRSSKHNSVKGFPHFVWVTPQCHIGTMDRLIYPLWNLVASLRTVNSIYVTLLTIAGIVSYHNNHTQEKKQQKKHYFDFCFNRTCNEQSIKRILEVVAHQQCASCYNPQSNQTLAVVCHKQLLCLCFCRGIALTTAYYLTATSHSMQSRQTHLSFGKQLRAPI